MYQSKYVKATLQGFFTEANHHEIIDKYAKESWRLIQVLPVEYNGHGNPNDFEIIFEQKIDT